MITRERPALNQCWESELRQIGQAATVRLDVNLSIGGSGTVTSVTTRGESVGTLSECIERKVRRWRFPLVSGSTQTSFPLVFSGTETAAAGGGGRRGGGGGGGGAASGPEMPSRGDVVSAMQGVQSAVSACGNGEPGTATVAVTITGSTGRVTVANVSGQFAGTPVGSCIARAVRGATFPRFTRPTFTVNYPFRI